jgi:hypothetical protein
MKNEIAPTTSRCTRQVELPYPAFGEGRIGPIALRLRYDNDKSEIATSPGTCFASP